MVLLELERAAAQSMVAAQRLDAGTGRRDQVVDDRARDGVAMKRGVERRLVAARAGVKPVALADAVIERRVGVERLVVRAVVREKRLTAIGLIPVGREDRAVMTVGNRDLITGAELVFRELGHRGRMRQ